MDITFNIEHVYFSRAGSYLSIRAEQGQLIYHTCSKRAVTEKWMPFEANDFFALQPMRGGQAVPFTWTAYPDRLELHTAAGDVLTVAFVDGETLVFGSATLDLQLKAVKTLETRYQPYPHFGGLVDWAAKGVHQFRVTEGTTLQIDSEGTVTFTGENGAAGGFQFVPAEAPWEAPLPTVTEAAAAVKAEFDVWLQDLDRYPARYQETAARALHVLWNNVVSARNTLPRPAVYVSKAWMNATWSWDNCFHALGVVRAAPELAWDQLLLFALNQHAYGLVPDQVHDMGMLHTFAKPPIFGWAARRLTEVVGLEAARPYLEALYAPIARQTMWWYTLRDTDGDGMAQYHHGNDSGWDNATTFDEGYPVEGADLAAHLVVQMEALAWMAEQINKPDEAAQWRERAQRQYDVLMAQNVRDDHFVTVHAAGHAVVESQSLLNYIPLVLGSRLPPRVCKALAADLQPGGAYLTEWGLASEPPTSPKYEHDGYWRGPIWAPSNHLIVMGLVEAGEIETARTIAERFCHLVMLDAGFWENYDAVTGKGLRCPGMGWTASGFLELAAWLGRTNA
ncbi:MAG: hypothetical protein OHK0046_16900 [Anaerolineae bacterium]